MRLEAGIQSPTLGLPQFDPADTVVSFGRPCRVGQE